MAKEDLTSWRTIRAQRPLNQERVSLYGRLMEIEAGQDVLLSTLAGCVEALDGHLEVKAVFPDETVALRGPGVPPQAPPQ